MKKLIIFLLMMLPLGVFAQESKIAIVNTQEVIQALSLIHISEPTRH